MIRLLPLLGYCFIISLFFSGCSTTQKSGVAALIGTSAESAPGMLPAAVAVDGLPVSFLHQQLIGTFAGGDSAKQRQIQAVAERKGDVLELVALSGAGLQLYKVSYDGKTLDSTKSLLLPDAFNPWQIVSDFMAMYADKNALLSAIAPYGWTVEQSQTSASRMEQQQASTQWQRTIKNAEGEPVLAVECPGSNAQSCFRSAQLQNLQMNYGLTARTLAYENNKRARQGGGSGRAAEPEHHAQQQNALGRVCRIARRPLSGACRH